MSEYTIRPARAGDSRGLLNLLSSTAQEGAVRLTFEREPDYFHAASVSTSSPEIWVMDHQHAGIVGTFSIGKRAVFVNGEKTEVRYGSDLRIHPAFQRGRALFRMFGQYRESMQNDWMQTVILDDNKASMNTVGSGRNILPQYVPAGHFTTRLISNRKRTALRTSRAVRRADVNDISAMQAFFDREAANKQFYPCYDFSLIGSDDPYYRDQSLQDFFILEEKGEITGIAALWNQKSFKQTRVSGYSGSLKYLRPVYNASTRFTGMLPLPAVNAVNRYLTLHSVVVKNNRPARFSKLLNTIRRIARRYDVDGIACGFDSRDPLLKVLQRCPGHTLTSQHFLATYQPEAIADINLSTLVYPEISRL